VAKARPRVVSFRLRARSARDGRERTVARSASLERLARRLRRDGELWRAIGLGELALEDNSLGRYTATLAEDLRGRNALGELAWRDFDVLLEHALD
jgi:hypothetical protein